MKHYQWGVTQGLSQLSKEERDELKSAAKEYNCTGTPPELRRSNARRAFRDVTWDYCMTASRHFGYRTFVFYVPESKDDGEPGVFDPSLDLDAKCPLNSVFNEKLVLGKLGEFVQAETSSVVSANVKGPSKKQKKLSYKDEITIPIRRDGHRIILEPEYLCQEQAR
ncbi:hypothetical protein BC826DRAFT_975793, partial [Russula brevipes]